MLFPARIKQFRSFLFELPPARLREGFINYSKAASNKFITYFVEQKSKGDGVHSGKKKSKKKILIDSHRPS
jgi:hypothetical protein